MLDKKPKNPEKLWACLEITRSSSLQAKPGLAVYIRESPAAQGICFHKVEDSLCNSSIEFLSSKMYKANAIFLKYLLLITKKILLFPIPN